MKSSNWKCQPEISAHYILNSHCSWWGDAPVRAPGKWSQQLACGTKYSLELSLCSLPTLKMKKGNCLVTQQRDIAPNKVPWKFQTIPCRDEKGGVGDNGPCGQSPKSGREHWPEVLCKDRENKEREMCKGVRGIKNRAETPSSIIFFLSCNEKHFRKITILLAGTQLLCL